ncbi:MAG: hypothetical protein O7F69_01360, partial [Alphaproteobacteria bacterium]|nr:hypothetical protein [Alphaproteobacteria bacterium]
MKRELLRLTVTSIMDRDFRVTNIDVADALKQEITHTTAGVAGFVRTRGSKIKVRVALFVDVNQHIYTAQNQTLDGDLAASQQPCIHFRRRLGDPQHVRTAAASDIGQLNVVDGEGRRSAKRKCYVTAKDNFTAGLGFDGC